MKKKKRNVTPQALSQSFVWHWRNMSTMSAPQYPDPDLPFSISKQIVSTLGLLPPGNFLTTLTISAIVMDLSLSPWVLVLEFSDCILKCGHCDWIEEVLQVILPVYVSSMGQQFSTETNQWSQQSSICLFELLKSLPGSLQVQQKVIHDLSRFFSFPIFCICNHRGHSPCDHPVPASYFRSPLGMPNPNTFFLGLMASITFSVHQWVFWHLPRQASMTFIQSTVPCSFIWSIGPEHGPFTFCILHLLGTHENWVQDLITGDSASCCKFTPIRHLGLSSCLSFHWIQLTTNWLSVNSSAPFFTWVFGT